jgi:hypothetical protein
LPKSCAYRSLPALRGEEKCPLWGNGGLTLEKALLV